MKIVYLTHVNVHGIRAHVHNTLKTVEALQRAGGQVTLLSMDVPPTTQAWTEIVQRHSLVTEFQRFFLGRVTFDRLMQSSRLKRAWSYLQMNFFMSVYLWKHRSEFDVVYHRFHFFVLPELLWRFLVRKPVVYESHYVYIQNRFLQAFTVLAIRSATCVVAITDGLKKYYQLSDERAMVVPCHASEFELVPTATPAELREELQLPGEATILCYTGTIGVTIQGISYEVETMVDVLLALPESSISVIVGAKEEKDKKALEDRACALNVVSRVIIRPWSDRATIMKYLVASDILMLPRVGTAPGSSP